MTNRLTDADFQNRFWSKVDQRNSCWLWLGTFTYNGYGHFFARLNGQKFYRAHRYSWALHNGPIPDGLHICHNCDNRFCVNPDHLFAGTQQDNNRDQLEKDRVAKGEGQGFSKLTEDQVREIRASDASPKDLAKKYDIHPTAITAVRKRKNWAWLD